MKNYNTVFQLVKSMSMSEKRQFKLYSNRHVIQKEKQYVILFDALDRLHEFDEELLIEQLAETGISIRFIKASIHYLYDLILKSLMLFHSGKTVTITLNEWLTEIEILYHKGNFKSCIKHVYKAQHLARSADEFLYLLKLLHYEKLVNAHVSYYNRTDEAVGNEIKTIYKLIENSMLYVDLFNKATHLRITIAKSRASADINKLEKLLSQKLLSKTSYALCTESKIKYYQIHAINNFIQRNNKKELANNEAVIQLMDSKPNFKSLHLLEYVNTFARILSITKNTDEAQFYLALERIRNTSISTDELHYTRIAAQIFIFSYMTEFSFYLQNKYFIKSIEIIPEIEIGMKKYKDILIASYHVTIIYMLAYYYFCIGDFDKAGNYINQLLNEFEEKNRPDIYNFAKLLNLFIHLEKGNFTYIKYKQANVRYYFKKQSALHATENAILDFFSKEKNYSSNFKQSLLTLSAELSEMQQDKMERFTLNYFDVNSWIKAKLNGKKTIADLFA